MSGFVYASMRTESLNNTFNENNNNIIQENNNNNFIENKNTSLSNNDETIKNLGRRLWKLYMNQFNDPIDEIIKKCDLEMILELWPEEYAVWKKKQHNYEKEFCSICLEYCNDAPMYVKCGHAYHQNCIKEWLSSKSSCPVCRENI
jgi:hypothetical protein